MLIALYPNSYNLQSCCTIILMIFDLTKTDYENKTRLLRMFREEAKRLLEESSSQFSSSQYKKHSAWLNTELSNFKDIKIAELEKELNEQDESSELLSAILHTTYAYYVVLLESRNDVWPYEYMAFSRRIGELWEPFCQLCWHYPVATDLKLVDPPKYKEAKKKKIDETDEFIDSLAIDDVAQKKMKAYYKEVWDLLDSGGIRLDLDLHYRKGDTEVASDFKSGFSSNEKGNTNRLLLVASLYRMLDGYKTILFVRQDESLNNHYLRTLTNSGLWEVFCGKEAYEKMGEETGFDLATWIAKNINWENDFDKKMSDYIRDNSLGQYLVW